MNQYVVCYKAEMTRDSQVYMGNPELCEALDSAWVDVNAPILVGTLDAPSESEALMHAATKEGCHVGDLIVVFEGSELNNLKKFAKEESFDSSVVQEQLRCLWTAYCIHSRLEVDTWDYDRSLMEVWNAITPDNLKAADWYLFEDFDKFMCRHLV